MTRIHPNASLSLGPSPALFLTMTPCLFQNLPLDLLRFIFQYLTMDDIVAYDNSAINHHLRDLYLSAMKSFQISNLNTYFLTKDLVNWILLREVSVKDVTIQSLDNSLLPFKLLSKHRSSIEKINLSPCAWLTIDEFNRLGEFPRLARFEILSDALTTEAVQNFLLLHPNIKDLKLSATMRVSEEIIITLINHCPHVEHLDLAYSGCVTNESMTLLMNSQLKLKSLITKGCDLDNQIIFDFVSFFPSLQLLSFDTRQYPFATSLFVFTQITLPSLWNNDPQVQLQGVKGLLQFVSDRQFYHTFDSTGVFPRLLVLLANNFHSVSYKLFILFYFIILFHLILFHRNYNFVLHNFMNSYQE
jgi:hypothetical protein